MDDHDGKDYIHYTHYVDHDDAQFADHIDEHKIVSRDEPDVYSLILPPNRCTKRCLNTCDVCLSLFVISPLVIIHWRGTWAMMDTNMEYFPPINCFIFGMVFHLVIAMVREFLYSEYKKTKSQKRTWTRVMCRSILTKLYAYLFSWTCQMHWRGGWAVIDQYFGIGWVQGLSETAFCLFFLLSFKSLRNVVAPPVLILTDTKEFAFGFPTRYRTESPEFIDSVIVNVVSKENKTMRGSTAGLADGMIATPESVHATFLHFIDIVFSSMILAPLVILYWRGTWNLTGLLLFSQNPQLSAIISLSAGILGHLVFNIFQEKLKKNLHPDKHRITYLVCSRIYTYMYGLACVNCWRGGWILMDHHVPHNLATIFTITFVSTIFLVLMKGMRNISASPFAISSDHSKDYFTVPTMFKVSAQDPGLYILDCACSVLVIGTLVVFVWRGTWVICDLVIYPDDTRMTAWGSLVIGYGIVALTFAMQSLMRWACDRLKGFWRVAAADIFLFLSFIGTVNVWRGVWQLCDLYFLKDSPILSNSMTHSFAFLLLALLNCSNSVLVRGVYIDAEEPAGQCVIFPIYYIRLFFQKERTKKQKRLIDALEKLEHNKTTEALLPDKASKTPVILPMNNMTNIHQRSIELQAMLGDVESINEKAQNGEHLILRSAED